VNNKAAKRNGPLSNFMRDTFKVVLDPVAGFLLKIGLTPNSVTLFGLLLTAAAGFLRGSENSSFPA